jgi:hypothetical protein
MAMNGFWGLLVAIDGYFIRGYWCFLLVIILKAISGYYISGYWWLLY